MPMRVNHAYLYWGVFLLALGGAIVVVNALAPDPAAVVDVLRYWPLVVIALGLGLVLRRTQFNVAGGMLAAAVPGLLLGSAIAVGPKVGWDCAPHDAELTSFQADQGTFSAAARVDVATGCGTLTITTRPGSGWELQAANTKGFARRASRPWSTPRQAAFRSEASGTTDGSASTDATIGG